MFDTKKNNKNTSRIERNYKFDLIFLSFLYILKVFESYMLLKYIYLQIILTNFPF